MADNPHYGEGSVAYPAHRYIETRSFAADPSGGPQWDFCRECGRAVYLDTDLNGQVLDYNLNGTVHGNSCNGSSERA